MISAAGIMYLTPDKQMLLVRRAGTSDHIGEWCFPGGEIEKGETPEEAARREAREELGDAVPDGKLYSWVRQIRDGVDFTTFVQKIDGPFTPTLNDENDAFEWRALKELVEPSPELTDTGKGNTDLVERSDEFNESDHPRGQPENAGQFAEKAGGARGHLTPASANREEWPEHIANLKVPPAWTDVQISQDADADLLVVGKDAKGRDQYVYSAKYAETQQAKKFQRIAALDSKFDKVMQQNSVNMRSKNKTVAEAAACQNLIMRMGLRPGSSKETGSEEQAYGATTLEGRHVVEEDGRVRLRFVGKKGVKLDLPVDDEKLADDLMDRAKSAGKDGRLFNISDNVLRMYAGTLDGGGFKVKDFRTYLGTSLASSLVEKAKPPANPAAYKKAVMAVAKQVAQRLGNTPSIALKAYISPLVFAPWKMASENTRADAVFKESEHQRDEDGKFAETAGGGGGGGEYDPTDPAVRDTKTSLPITQGKEIRAVYNIANRFADKRGELGRKANTYPIRKVRISDLVATQPGLNSKIVSNYTNNPPKSGHPDAVLVGGKYYLGDGHHRVEAAKERGETSILVHVQPGDTKALKFLSGDKQPKSDSRLLGFDPDDKSDESEATRDDSNFKESEHPRGQPENAGQFVETSSTKEENNSPSSKATPVKFNNKNWESTSYGKAARKFVGELPKYTMEDAINARRQLKKSGRLNDKGTVSLYHVTPSKNVGSILKRGLIPFESADSGELSSFATYFSAKKHTDNPFKDLEEEETTTLEVRIPITSTTLGRILPDEEFSKEKTGLGALLKGDAVAIIGGVPWYLIYNTDKKADARLDQILEKLHA